MEMNFFMCISLLKNVYMNLNIAESYNAFLDYYSGIIFIPF